MFKTVGQWLFSESTHYPTAATKINVTVNIYKHERACVNIGNIVLVNVVNIGKHESTVVNIGKHQKTHVSMSKQG